MANEYDFQINDLKFRAAISDKHPYQRATAPFRKEQFDSAPTVGDQSLTGWWTRGQLSFHKGAGLKYYEVLEGEAVLDRFEKSRDVSVFEPGEVRLQPQMEEVSSYVEPLGRRAEGAVIIPWSQNGYGTGDGVYFTSDGSPSQTLQFVQYPIGPTTAAVQITTVSSPAGGVENITTDGRHIWIRTASGIESKSSGTGATSVRYTHTSTIYGVAYAKGRLWIIDTNGDLYVEAAATSGAAAAISNKIGTLPKFSSLRVAEAPGGCYVTVGTNKVYFITVDAQGGIPTITAPVVAGELPSGEVVTAMRYYLGSLVLVTAAGFRVAATSDTGDIVFGPILKQLDYDTYCTSIATRGTSVFFAQQDESGSWGGASIYEIDLSRPIESQPGAYAWSEFTRYDATESDYCGVVDIYDGFVVWGANTLKYISGRPGTATTTLAASGYLYTGYHRFGTLDPKSFRHVTVKCGGEGGSISVFRVDADGTETLLSEVGGASTTVTPAETSKTFDLGMTSAAERIALKFVLTRDGADPTLGPALLGYQIKAMPVPERQRLMRWPLVVTDTFRTRYGKETGSRGRAYTTLKALEALESSASVVTYTDHRTGETGTAYVESIQFDSHTPSNHNTSGFGGVAQVTLRALS